MSLNGFFEINLKIARDLLESCPPMGAQLRPRPMGVDYLLGSVLIVFTADTLR